MTRSLLAVLRHAEELMPVWEIAIQVGLELGFNMDDQKATRPMTADARNALVEPRDGVVCTKRLD